jgi:methyl-accepting chemotaxis protein
MSIMDGFGLKSRFFILIGCFVAGLLCYGAWSFKVIGQIKVSGPIYERIVQSKDLIADILPPPEYIIESYLVCLQLNGAAGLDQQARLLERLQVLKAEYDTRHTFWTQQRLDPALKQVFLGDAHAAALAFYGIALGEFVPALRKQDKEAVSAAMARIERQYDLHRKAIDQVVQLASKEAEANEAEARQQIGSANWQMLAILAVALLVSVGVAQIILRSVFRQLGGDPAIAASIANRIAKGELTVQIDLQENDQSSLLHAMRDMQGMLANIIAQTRNGTETIAAASIQIARGNLDLSSRTAAQVATLERTTSAMEQLTAAVKQNADSALQADQLATLASDVARRGGAAITQVVGTMGSINDAARKIVDIIGVIDGIAFQTNILALNAAVEAARAGEQGRGFAVVASEVRSLAQRSAAAAREIKALIGDSVGQVEAGSKLVDHAGATMDEIVASVGRVTGIMGEITAASQEQSAGIAQVHHAIAQIGEGTAHNSALVVQAAAAATAMQEQADHLVGVVSIFKLHASEAVVPAKSAGMQYLTQDQAQALPAQARRAR